MKAIAAYLATGFKNVFEDINNYDKHPYITINEVDYTLEFFLSANYKVAKLIIIVHSYIAN